MQLGMTKCSEIAAIVQLSPPSDEEKMQNSCESASLPA